MKQLPTLTTRQVSRFWTRTKMVGSCLVWTGPDKVMLCGQKYKPAQVSYALIHGQPTSGQCIIRLCDTPNCVCPAHLKAVSVKDAGLRGYVGSVLKIRKTSAGLFALNHNKPLKLIESIKYGERL